MRKASKNNNRRDKSLSNKKFKSEDKNLNKTNKNNKQKVAKKASVKNTIIVSNKNEIRDEVRLNKYISETGFCSRREADKLIEQGRVKIDGLKATTGMKVSKGQSVSIDGKPLKVENELVYIALNKPVGITCTTESKIKGNIVDFINHEKRIFPIGRLDKDSQGLIILTNDGDLANEVLAAENNHEKEYIVTLDQPFYDDFIKKMERGVEILGQVTKPCKLKRINENTYSIILTQGLNRQIRRMSKVFGFNVVKLERIRILNITLEDIEYGKWRYINREEIEILKKLIK